MSDDEIDQLAQSLLNAVRKLVMNEELDMKELAQRSRNVLSPNVDEHLVITPQLGTDDDKWLYALEKSEMAVYTLATGPGNLKSRLVPAFSELIRIDFLLICNQTTTGSQSH